MNLKSQRSCPLIFTFLDLIYRWLIYRILRIMTTFLSQFAKTVDYISETRAPYNRDGASTPSGLLEKKVVDVRELVRKPAFHASDLPAYIDAIKNFNTVGIDDRELLLEKVLVLMSRLQNTEISDKIQQLAIGLLYKDLPHPPSSYLVVPTTTPYTASTPRGPIKYAFRPADGSNYNPLFPSLGKAGTPYARSVPSANFTPISTLPDPSLVFDTLLRREPGTFTPHPGGISSLFFAFADLVTHSIFNTNHSDWNINDASSYLDLSILYGSSDSAVDKVRRKDGTGRLWDDVFSDGRLLFMPPSSCALLVLMNRNHNYIAQKILDINERGSFTSPPPKDEDARQTQDDELFHRARLVNCGFFMHIILGDYVGAILGLVRDGSSWRLDPLMTMRETNHEFSPRGEGNAVSIKFNLLYRWHSTLSEKDAEWTANLFHRIFKGKEVNEITIQDFKEAAHEHMIPNPDPRKRTFNGLTRGPDGRFKDSDLAKILQDGTEWRAGAFQGRGTPEVLRVIEIMGIEQARGWGTCSLNEFRKFLGLRPYRNFKEWNPDPKIHTAAASLYKDINNLELHVGLQAEQAKEPGPGAGLCPGYTISRAILADAVALTRGDRFLTVDFTPFNLTSWGYQDCQYDTQDGSYGGLLTKLLYRTLPDHYPAGSAYAHFPFLDPVYMKQHLSETAKHLVDKYNWERPSVPLPTVVVDTHPGVTQVLTEPSFLSTYDKRLFTVIKEQPIKKSLFKFKAASEANAQSLIKGRNEVDHIILSYGQKWSEYFAAEAFSLFKAKAIKHIGSSSKTIDIVKDVINLLPVHWIAEEIVGLPLKTDTNERGAWYEDDAYEAFADVGRYIFMNSDPANDWRLRESSISVAKRIIEFIGGHLDETDSLISLKDTRNHLGIESNNSHHFIKRVDGLIKDRSHGELSTYIFSAVVPTAAHFSQAISLVVDFYLDDDKRREREEIVKLAASRDKNDTAKVMVYVREALRLCSPVSGVYRTAAKEVNIGPVTVRAGERVFASIKNANVDSTTFGPHPKQPEYSRTNGKAGILGIEQGLLSSKFFELTFPSILCAILGQKNIRRAPGQSGRLNKYTEDWHGCPQVLYINSRGETTPFADSLFIQFD